MDLGTIGTRLEKQEYTSVASVCRAVKLVFNNAIVYNGEASDIGALAIQCEKILEGELMKVLVASHSFTRRTHNFTTASQPRR